MSTELVQLPKELRIERRLGSAVRSTAVNLLPLALLAPLAFFAEILPVAIALLVIMGLSFRELRRARSFVLPHLELADSGDVDAAIDRLARLARAERDGHAKAFLLSLLGLLELRNGDRETAAALARESIRYGHNNPAIQRAMLASAAMIHSVRGEIDEALATLPDEPTPDPVTDMHRLVVWGRAGKWQQIADYHPKKLPLVDGLRHQNRLMALMRACALERTAGGALSLQRALDDARPRVADEFAYLTADWPELADFVDKHPELTRPRSSLQRDF
jgi:hypothetical protein